MLEESKFVGDVMKKNFKKELVMTKTLKKILKTVINVGFNVYIDSDFNVRNRCHITGKSRCSAHRDYNIKDKLHHNSAIVFHNLQNYDSHLIIEELEKVDFKINVIPN